MLSFSEEYLANDYTNSLASVFGILTPPESPTKVRKVQDNAGDDEILVQQVWATVANLKVQAAQETSRAPGDSLLNAAEVDQGSDSDAEGEVDPEFFPDFLGGEEEDEEMDTMTAESLVCYFAPAVQTEEKAIVAREPVICSFTPAVPPQEEDTNTRDRFTRCEVHTGQKKVDGPVLVCDKCEMMKCVNIIIQEERQKADAIKKKLMNEERRKAGLKVTEPRKQSQKTIERDVKRKEKIRNLILSGDSGLAAIKDLVPVEQFEKLQKDLKRRMAGNLFPYDSISI
ncbi:hypothetical protein QFC22_003404 [Naganishia vaughanmartiniae]|uniref:Uncharacterized protein n=1 Tax=Naganishia vaughanmartiniae TaxID=1424756 RepID=A0ACC2X6L0_9TREE|nr:hypothetical protein QFC22_003404 [Naganishia vaughanmartiniae]